MSDSDDDQLAEILGTDLNNYLLNRGDRRTTLSCGDYDEADLDRILNEDEGNNDSRTPTLPSAGSSSDEDERLIAELYAMEGIIDEAKKPTTVEEEQQSPPPVENNIALVPEIEEEALSPTSLSPEPTVSPSPKNQKRGFFSRVSNSNSASPRNKSNSPQKGWSSVTNKILGGCKAENTQSSILDDGSTLKDEIELLEQIIAEIEADDESTVSDTDLGLNETIIDVDTILKNAERAVNRRNGSQSEAPSHQYSTLAASSTNFGKIPLLKHTNYSEISAELYERRNDAGFQVVSVSATAVATPLAKRRNIKISFAVGTADGGVMLFTDAGKRCDHLSAPSASAGMCTCIDLFHTGEAVACGYQNGSVVLFDTVSRTIMRTLEGEWGAPLHRVQWMLSTDPPNKICGQCIHGTVKIIALRKMLKMTQVQLAAGVDKEMLEISNITIKPPHRLDLEAVPLLAMASRKVLTLTKVKFTTASISIPEPFYSFDNPHDAPRPGTERETTAADRAALAKKGKAYFQSVRKKEAERKLREDRAIAFPTLSWLTRRDPELVVLWHDFLFVVQVDSNSLLDKDMRPRIIPVAQVLLKYAAVSCVYMSQRAVTVIDSRGTILVVDPRVSPTRATVDASDIKLTLDVTVASSGGRKSVRQAICGYVNDGTASLLALGRAPVSLLKWEILRWDDRLQLLGPSIEALTLAKQMRLGEAAAVVGLPEQESSRNSLLDESIERMIAAYLTRETESSNTTSADMWRSLGLFLFEYCCSVELPGLLFTGLYKAFCQYGMTNIWATLLEPCIRSKKVSGMPNFFVNLLAEWLLKGAVLCYIFEGPHECNGSPDKVIQIAHDSSHNPRVFTIDVFVKPSTSSKRNVQTPVSSLCYKTNSGWSFTLTENSIWSLELGTGDDIITMSDTSERPAESYYPEWTRLTAVYASGEANFYINKQLVDSQEVYSFIPNTGSPLIIGGTVRESSVGSGVVDIEKSFIGGVKNLFIYSSTHYPFVEVSEDYEQIDLITDDIYAPSVREEASTMHPSEPNTLFAADDLLPEIASISSSGSETGSQITSSSPLSRLEALLLNLTPESMAEFSATADGYITPLTLLFGMLGKPVPGSVVRHTSQSDCGTVIESEPPHLVIDFSGDIKKISAGELTVTQSSPPNKWVRRVLLEYLKRLFRGRTFNIGHEVPKEQLRSIKKNALDFLFHEDSGKKESKIHHRSYPVLEELMKHDAEGVILAIIASFKDDSVSYSPWRKILAPGVRPLTLMEAPQPSSRFRLSRDEVIAVLITKLNVSEFQPFEASKTFQRPWPAKKDVVSLFLLIAESISREVIQPKKFNKDMIKRVVTHLTHACPPEETIARQKKLEAMLEVALHPEKGCWGEAGLSEEETAQLSSLVQAAGFAMLQIYFYKRDNDYMAVLRSYLQAHHDPDCLIEDDAVFVFLEETMGRASHATSDRQSKLQKAVVENFMDLVKVNSTRAAQLGVKCLRSEHSLILKQLDADPKTQYGYLQSLYTTTATQPGDPDDDDYIDLPSLFDAETVMKFISLLCMFDERTLLDFLRKNEGVVEIPRMLHIIERTVSRSDDQEGYGEGRDSAKAYLYSKTGRYGEALNLLFNGLPARMQEVRARVVDRVAREQYYTASHASGVSYDISSPAFGFGTTKASTTIPRTLSDTSHAILGDLTIAQEILQTREARAVFELIDIGASLCTDAMNGGGPDDDGSHVWFTLLDKFIRPKKILSDVEKESFEWFKFEAVIGGIAIVATTLIELRLSRKQTMKKLSSHEPTQGLERRNKIRDLRLGSRISISDSNVVDELAEVSARERIRTKYNPSRRLLVSSFSPHLFSANQRMQELYTQFITHILLQMMIKMHNSQATTEQEAQEINELRNKVEGYRLQACGQPKTHISHDSYKEMRVILNQRTRRVEATILGKIISEHNYSTFTEFRVVLLGILENVRFEKSLQRAFHDCLNADMHHLERRSLKCVKASMSTRVVGLPPWTPTCAICKTRLSESQEVMAFMCGHAYHYSCFRAKASELSEKCPHCFRRPKSKGESKVDPSPAAPQSRKAPQFDRRLERRIKLLNSRLSFKPASLALSDSQLQLKPPIVDDEDLFELPDSESDEISKEEKSCPEDAISGILPPEADFYHEWFHEEMYFEGEADLN